MPPKLPPKKPSLKEQAKVLFAYTAENDDELSIKEGDIINIISKKVEDKGWWKGELNGKIGVFPDNFVELIKTNSTTTNNQNTNNTSFSKQVSSNSFILNNGNGLASTDTNEENCPKLPKKSSETKLSTLITGKLSEIILKANESKSANSTLLKQESIKSNSNTSTPNLSLKSNKSCKQDASENSSSADLMIDNSENDLNSIIDDSQNSIKLKHLTASRVKGPRDRRPPSIIQLPKDDETTSINSSLNNSKELLNSSEKILSTSLDENQTNKELTKQNSKNNINEMPKQQTQVTTPTTTTQQNVPPWMIELKKTQAEKKEVKKKNFSLEDSFSLANNSTSPNSLKSIQTPNSPTKTTNNRMSGDYSQRFKDYVHQQLISGTNSLSRHCSINSSNNFTNTSRTLSTDSLDSKEQQPPALTFGNLISPAPCKPAKAIKPTAAKLMNSNNSVVSNNINNSNKINNQPKDTIISRKEFDDLQKKVFELTEVVENHKQMYKNLVTDLINECAEEKKKVANLTIEVDRLRKLTTTV